MVKIIVWVTFMILASWFVLYEMLDIFVFKDQHAFLYEMFMFAMKGSVIETNDWGGIFITIIGGILTWWLEELMYWDGRRYINITIL